MRRYGGIARTHRSKTMSGVDTKNSDFALQRELLAKVSRTFALTIPALPDRLERVVGNAYLLCRIIDTIEDAAELDADAQAEFFQQFIAVVKGTADAGAFARALAPEVAGHASADECRLIEHTPRVLAITAGFSAEEQAALADCITTMGRGMARFQRCKSRHGLANLAEHSEYCYVVAGCVGEMLTRLFIAHVPQLAARRRELMRLAVAFGQCLQMTNILKDFWEDSADGVCWLPRDVFAEQGLDLAAVRPGDPRFVRGYRRLLGVARACDNDALAYVLLLPERETAMRNFCLWALYMAVLTQRKIAARPGFGRGEAVKISRRSVRLSVAWSRLAAGQDKALKASFALLERGLPDAEPATLERSA